MLSNSVITLIRHKWHSLMPAAISRARAIRYCHKKYCMVFSLYIGKKKGLKAKHCYTGIALLVLVNSAVE